MVTWILLLLIYRLMNIKRLIIYNKVNTCYLDFL